MKWQHGDLFYIHKQDEGERFPPGYYVVKIIGIDKSNRFFHFLIYWALHDIPAPEDISKLEKKAYILFSDTESFRRNPVYLGNRSVTEDDVSHYHDYPHLSDKQKMSWNIGDLFYTHKGTEGKLFPPGYYVHKIIARNEEKHILHVLTYAPLDHIPTKDDISDLDIRAYHLPHDGNAYFHATYLDNRPVEEHELKGYYFHNEMLRAMGQDEI